MHRLLRQTRSSALDPGLWSSEGLLTTLPSLGSIGLASVASSNFPGPQRKGEETVLSRSSAAVFTTSGHTACLCPRPCPRTVRQTRLLQWTIHIWKTKMLQRHSFSVQAQEETMHLIRTDNGMRQWPGSHLMSLKASRAAPAASTDAPWSAHGGVALKGKQLCVPKASRDETEATGAQPMT